MPKATRCTILTSMWLHRRAIAHPKTTLLVALAVLLICVPGVTQLQLRTDGHALVPVDAPAVETDREIRARFGVEDPIVILVRSEHRDGIFNSETLQLVRDLTEVVESARDVGFTSVSSLATERGDRYGPSDPNAKPHVPRPRRFLDPVPDSPETLAELRDDLRVFEIYRGTLVSSDERATALFVGIDPARDRVEIYRWLRQNVETRSTASQRIDAIGAPVAEALLGLHLLEDLGLPRSITGVGTHAAPVGESGLAALRTTIRSVGLIPLALVLLVLIFFAVFRSATAVALPLLEVGACLAVVFGLMGYLGVPVYLTIAVLPVILTAMGIADEIHVFTEHRRQRTAQPESSAARVTRDALDHVARPIMKTSITSTAGFLSFTLSPLPAVQAFGGAAAGGILFCMVWSLTVVPALLVLLDPRSPRRASRLPRRVESVARFAIERRGWVVVVMAALLITAPIGAQRLLVQDSWLDGFTASSPFRQATQAFNTGFRGAHQLLIEATGQPLEHHGTITAREMTNQSVSIPDPDPEQDLSLWINGWLSLRRNGSGGALSSARIWRAPIESATREGDTVHVRWDRRNGSARFLWQSNDSDVARFEITTQAMLRPEVLAGLSALRSKLEKRTDLQVGGTIGPSDYVATTSFIIKKRAEGSLAVPPNPKDVERLWNNYLWLRGEERLREVVTDDRQRALVTVFLRDANFRDTATLIRMIESEAKQSLEPLGISVALAGDVPVSQTLIAAIVSTQVQSLLLSLFVIFVVATLLQRSLGWGLFCVLPSTLAVGATFSIMGWFEIPLGVATSMFASMTLGIGVDYAIHFTERFRATAPGANKATQAVAAMRLAGPAITIDALCVAVGFGVLTISQVPANARLGALLAVGLITCLVATILLGPIVAVGRGSRDISDKGMNA